MSGDQEAHKSGRTIREVARRNAEFSEEVLNRPFNTRQINGA
jgi:hypothetical protein